MFGEEETVDEARQEIRHVVSDAVASSQTSRVESHQAGHSANAAHLAALNESSSFLRGTLNAPSEYYGSDFGKEEAVEFKPPVPPSTFGASSSDGFKVPELPAKPHGRHGLRVGDETFRYVKGTTMTVKQYACTKCNRKFQGFLL